MHNAKLMAVSVMLFLMFIGIYTVTSVFVIDKHFKPDSVAISEMKLYAGDIARDTNTSVYEGKYDLIIKRIGDIKTAEDSSSLLVVLRYKNEDNDIRMSAQYPVRIVNNKILVDEANAFYNVNNSNQAGLKFFLAITLIITYLKLRGAISKKKHWLINTK